MKWTKFDFAILAVFIVFSIWYAILESPWRHALGIPSDPETVIHSEQVVDEATALYRRKLEQEMERERARLQAEVDAERTRIAFEAEKRRLTEEVAEEQRRADAMLKELVELDRLKAEREEVIAQQARAKKAKEREHAKLVAERKRARIAQEKEQARLVAERKRAAEIRRKLEERLTLEKKIVNCADRVNLATSIYSSAKKSGGKTPMSVVLWNNPSEKLLVLWIYERLKWFNSASSFKDSVLDKCMKGELPTTSPLSTSKKKIQN